MDKFAVIIRLERNSVSILWNWVHSFSVSGDMSPDVMGRQ